MAWRSGPLPPIRHRGRGFGATGETDASDRAVVGFRQEERHDSTSQFLSNLPTDGLTFAALPYAVVWSTTNKWKVTAEPLTSDAVRNREKVRRRQSKAVL